MKKANSISVKVRAPALGLITRYPTESADWFPTGTILPVPTQRAAVVASNVRYEDGTVGAAPGFKSILLQTALLDNLLAFWPMTEATGTRYDTSGNGNNLSVSPSVGFNAALDALPGLFGGNAAHFPAIPYNYPTGAGFSIWENGAPLVGEVGNLAGTVASLSFSLWSSNSPQLFAINPSGFDAPYLFSTAPALIALETGSWSLGFWFQSLAPGPAYNQTVIWSSPAFELILQNNGTLVFNGNDSVNNILSQIGTTGPLIAGWNYIGMSYDFVNQTMTLVLNSEVDTVSMSSPPSSADASYSTAFQFNTVALQDTLTAPSAFLVDSATLWGRALIGAEFESIWNNGNGLDYPFAGGAFTLIQQGNLINSTASPILLGSGFQLYNGDPAYDTTESQYQLALNLLYSGTQTSQGFSWFATSFEDKMVIAQHDNPPQYWIPPYPNMALPLPGIPTSSAQADGVTNFFGHVVLWYNDILTWSDEDDFTTWIPVATTAVSAVLNTTQPFIQPAPGSRVTVTVANTVTAVVSISLSAATTLAFGDVTVGQTAQSVLLISNTGTAPLTVSAIALPPGFTLATPFGTQTIPVNGNIPVTIVFSPTIAGGTNYGGVVSVTSDATTGTRQIPISGTGVGTYADIALSGVLAFGNVIKGRQVYSTMLITNNGTGPLTVSSISLPAAYSLLPPTYLGVPSSLSPWTNTWAGTVAAGATASLPIRFIPTAIDHTSFNGVITVNSNGNIPPGSVLTTTATTIAVSGAGASTQTQTAFVTDNGTCQFGSVTVGNSASGLITVWNNSLTDLFKVTNLTLPGGFSTTYNTQTQIPAGQYITIPVKFTPTAPGQFVGSATVSTTENGPIASNGSSLITPVTGTGVSVGSTIVLSGSLDFGNIPENGVVSAVLTITNAGNATLNVSSITLSPSNADISIGPTAVSIAPQMSTSIIVTFTPTSIYTYVGTVTVNSDASAGTDTFEISGSGIANTTAAPVVPGQYMTTSYTDANGNTTYGFYTVVSMNTTTNSLVLQSVDTTGNIPSAPPNGPITLPTGTQIFSLDANEAGTTRVTGTNYNGVIFQVIPQNDYAYIFKEFSIQSLQYVGQSSGTFTINPEVAGEGPISRNAVVNLYDGRFVFLGHRDLYVYTGGPNLQFVCRQYTRQLFKELDRTRLYAVLLYHNLLRNEVWIQYPLIGGGFRVLIWNYFEDTATLDNYDPTLQFTAISQVDWVNSPNWTDMPDVAWDAMDTTVTWENISGGSAILTLLASQDGGLRVYGTNFDRDGEGYLAISETMDFDFGDMDLWKYVDVVILGIQVQNPTTESQLLYIQVGASTGLDSDPGDIIWTNPASVQVNGTQTTPIRVNPGGAGRFLRLRFYSVDPGLQWRISSFEIHCRPGGFY